MLEATPHFVDNMKYITGFLPDTEGNFPTSAIGTNTRGLERNSIMSQCRTANGDKNIDITVRGSFKIAHLLFEKIKIWAPYLPMQLEFCRNKRTAVIKNPVAATDFSGVKITITEMRLVFDTYELNQEGYGDKFQKAYMKDITTPADMSLPINPYSNPLAIYNYLDVRSDKRTVAANVQTYTFPIKAASNLPKAIIFALSPGSADNETNHLQFDLAPLKSYNIVKNGQSIIPCEISLDKCNQAHYQDAYLRTRNFMRQKFSSFNNYLYYQLVANGAGIVCELLNPQNTLNVVSKLELGNLELQLAFKQAAHPQYQLVIFTIYDQSLIIDEKFNATLF
ncbi:hypothetical protein KR749_14675, partial [Staphylococcus aureus]|nr:hypothetical protein [Staphylococcus aureus]